MQFFGAVFVHAQIMVLQHIEDSVTSGEAEKYRCIRSLWRLKQRFSMA